MNTKVKKRTTPKTSQRTSQKISGQTDKRKTTARNTAVLHNIEKNFEKTSPAAAEENFGIPNLEIEELSFDAKLNPIHYTVTEETSPQSTVILGSMQPVAGFKPEILAPAGDKASFLAGLAAGADAGINGAAITVIRIRSRISFI